MSIIKFNPFAPSILVEVRIKKVNSVSLLMVLDTGASYTLIPWASAKVIGCRPEISKTKVRIITASGIEYVPAVKISTITALGKSNNNFTALCHDLPQETYVDGLLGLDFLRHFHLSIDFKKGILKLI